MYMSWHPLSLNVALTTLAAGHGARGVRLAPRDAAGGAGVHRFPRRAPAGADRPVAAGLPGLRRSGRSPRQEGQRDEGRGRRALVTAEAAPATSQASRAPSTHGRRESRCVNRRPCDNPPAQTRIHSGEMAERFKAPVLKTGEGANLPLVRIPLSPPSRLLPDRKTG